MDTCLMAASTYIISVPESQSLQKGRIYNAQDRKLSYFKECTTKMIDAETKSFAKLRYRSPRGFFKTLADR